MLSLYKVGAIESETHEIQTLNKGKSSFYPGKRSVFLPLRVLKISVFPNYSKLCRFVIIPHLLKLCGKYK